MDQEMSAEDVALLQRAEQQIKRRGNERINIIALRRWRLETNLQTLISVVSMVQLALRHPNVANLIGVGTVSRQFVTELIEKIDPTHGDVWDLMHRGFDEAHDVPSKFVLQQGSEEDLLHTVICQAVAAMNNGETHQGHTILRQALVDYADRHVS